MEVAEESRLSAATVARLAGLGRLWGVVKFFHPALATGEVDWDGALVSTVPLVLAANSADDYRRAVDHLLATLEDPVTRTLPPAEPATDPPGAPAIEGATTGAEAAEAAAIDPPQPRLERTADGLAVVIATDQAQLQPSDRDLVGAFRAVFEEASEARGLVVDVRGLDAESSWWAEWAIVAALPHLLTAPLRTAGCRHRMHRGHRQQRGPAHGGYYSAVVDQPGDLIAPSERGRRLPIAFVVSGGSPDFYRLLCGLQVAGLAIVVHEGEAHGAGTDWHELELPDGITARVRLADVVAPDGTLGFWPDAVVPRHGQPGWTPDRAVATALTATTATLPERTSRPPAALPTAQHERDYPELTAPPPAYRLLALFRLWNTIHYLFPYKDLLDGDWDAVLAESVPAFAREGDNLDYALTVARLVARLQDTHAGVDSAALRDYLGTHVPPLRLRTVEGETVVVHLMAETPGVAVGDVVVAVDGEGVDARRARLAELVAASTPQALRRRLDLLLLSGAEDSPAALTMRDRSGTECTVTLRRTARRGDAPATPTLPVFGILPEGFGYVDLTRLTIPQVDEAFAAVSDTPGLIFDLRGYPNGTAWSIAPRLTDREVATARFSVPEIHSPDLAEMTGAIRFRQTAAPSPAGHYRGKVVVLIDARAISQAEHTCLYLEATADATFVGGPTNGANGNVTNLVLPGGIEVTFTGMEVRHADGRQLQRLGIQPHVPVEPTLAGVRAGRDEVLAAAVALLRDETGRASAAGPRNDP
ncbi:MAG TPA: S41 family peptidase [Thermomicrobiales bacterium]|jgi:C-terminal processing protease CtpA/Prc